MATSEEMAPEELLAALPSTAGHVPDCTCPKPSAYCRELSCARNVWRIRERQAVRLLTVKARGLVAFGILAEKALRTGVGTGRALDDWAKLFPAEREQEVP